VCSTVRAPDGLALSSRNIHLSGEERARASAIHRALVAIQHAVAAGERDPVAARAQALAELRSSKIEPDYLELVSTDTFDPVKRIEGELLAVVAARVGATRLIDNEIIQPLSTAHAAGSTDNGRP
jgi:pantoate--beta-alanine ligase